MPQDGTRGPAVLAVDALALGHALDARSKAIAVALQTPALLAGAAAFRDFTFPRRGRAALLLRDGGILRVLAVHALAGVAAGVAALKTDAVALQAFRVLAPTGVAELGRLGEAVLGHERRVVGAC